LLPRPLRPDPGSVGSSPTPLHLRQRGRHKEGVSKGAPSWRHGVVATLYKPPMLWPNLWIQVADDKVHLADRIGLVHPA
jgi:hypothetical protein